MINYKIIIMLAQENEPLFLGEIVFVLEINWFIVKKCLEQLIDMDVVVFENKMYRLR